MKYYHPLEIEPKWQKKWAEKPLFSAEDFSTKPKKYFLVEFPYSSGEGLHLGHAFTFIIMDVLARQQRMKGINVLYPMGWDAFGLPTENYALKTGIHPIKVTKTNTDNFRVQMNKLGFAYNWEREVNTTDPKYYKWTQWIFLQFFKNDLAYKAEIPVGWCPSCKIILANEEIVDGKCERCGTEAERRRQSQWMLKITKYADRLADELDLVDYPEPIKTAQRNWIGRSEGTEIDFQIEDKKIKTKTIKVFTTRADTIFGVTALVVAPEHPLVEEMLVLCEENKVKEIKDYLNQAKKKSELERTELSKEKSGVFTGFYCLNPVNQEKVAIWIGDYVIATYGGGAVMVVPAHDTRDYDFAKKYKLEIREVVAGGDITKEAFIDYGKLINSGEFNNLDSQNAIKKITAWLEEKKSGRKTISYKLRDWIFSRQHYWGEPIPIIHCSKCGLVPVAEKDLPVELPYVEKYEPSQTGESPLALIDQWVNVKCPKCNGPAKRETDTMPNWAGSSWYFLRYCDPLNNSSLADFKKLDYWLPVDLYFGGAEHTTLHLLYSRFWHKFLNDIKLVPGKEPYQLRRQHGMILGEDGEKMSKSRGNVINPNVIIDKFGADTLRLFLLFMGPYEQTMPWNSQGVEGCWRFLNRVWRLVTENDFKKQKASEGINKLVHQTIKKVTEDIEKLHYNTAIAKIMELVNAFYLKPKEIDQKSIEALILLLAPMAPFFAEELWTEVLKNKFSVHEQPWLEYDKQLIKEELTTIMVQVNGKTRGEVVVPTSEVGDEKKVTEIAKKENNVAKFLEAKEIKKVIFVPGRIINFLVS